MRTPSPFSARGVTIIETMIAMVVLGIGLVGSLAALQRGATEARLGQNRQVKMMLAEAALQRVKLQDKNTFFAGLAGQPSVYIGNLDVGAAPWLQDPTVNTDPLDFSMGAFFNILPDGTIVPLNVVGPCTAATVPVGTICREVFTHLGGPYHATNVMVPALAMPAGARVATAWVRVTRKTNKIAGSNLTDRLDAEDQIVLNQVVVQ